MPLRFLSKKSTESENGGAATLNTQGCSLRQPRGHETRHAFRQFL